MVVGAALGDDRAQPDRHQLRRGRRAEGGELSRLVGLAGRAEGVQRGDQLLLERLVEVGGTGHEHRPVGALGNADQQGVGLDVGHRRLGQGHGSHEGRCY